MGRAEDTRFPFFKYITVKNDSTFTALLGHIYLVATGTKLHLRRRGKIKAIYTDNIVDRKEQPSLDWHSSLTKSYGAHTRGKSGCSCSVL